MALVPHTRTLLKGNISISTIPGGMFMADAATIAQNLGALTIVGAAQRLVINQIRSENNFRREFDPARQGKPVETYPGLASYSISLHRTLLYDTNFLEAFGFVGSNIVDQYKAIVVVASQVGPVDAQGNALTVAGLELKAHTYIIPGCWINNYPLEFDITDEDQRMVQEIEMICQDVFTQ